MSINGTGPALASTKDEALSTSQRASNYNHLADANQPDEFPIGCVYFLELASQRVIKIGSSINPAGRVKHMASLLPEPPVLLGTIAGGASEEMRWHARWAPIRHYREWFNATPELRAAITAAVNGGES